MLVIQRILDLLFGQKYYANIINTRGTFKYEISCFIFRTREQAEQHRLSLADNRSFMYIETVSFRSRHEY